jgi:hypothetical protein
MSVTTTGIATSIQKCANVVCINGLQRNKHNFEIKETRIGFCSYCWGEMPTVVQTKVHFNNRIAYMSDGTCRFENYPHSFDGALSALKWGRAYEAALDAQAKACLDLEDLMREVGIYN